MFVLIGSSVCLLEAVQELLGLVYVHSCAGMGYLVWSAESCSGTVPQSAESGKGSAVVWQWDWVGSVQHPQSLSCLSSSSQPLSSTVPCFLNTVVLHFLLVRVFFNVTGSGTVSASETFLALVLGCFFLIWPSPLSSSCLCIKQSVTLMPFLMRKHFEAPFWLNWFLIFWCCFLVLCCIQQFSREIVPLSMLHGWLLFLSTLLCCLCPSWWWWCSLLWCLLYK